MPKSRSTREKNMVMVILTEQEILDVLKDKRRFTATLQVNGILDILDQKHKEAEEWGVIRRKVQTS